MTEAAAVYNPLRSHRFRWKNMPIYEYECSKCRYYAEVMQKITDQPLKKCPSCGKTTFKKLLSAPVFRLKGSGWYETDFKSDKENKRNLAASDKEEASSQSKSESKTESKTETTAAAGGDGESESKTEAKAKADAKADGKSGGKGETTASTPAPKPPAPTTRNVAARSARGGGKGSGSSKSAVSKRARPPKRESTKRRGGR
ncbi:MAG: FmdB family zinc ribbon protein [Steroidobacteraceae bacterium]|jgi:putative FmdB family regulatory protein